MIILSTKIESEQNRIGIYSVLNFLRHLMLHCVLNFQMDLNLRNHFRIQRYNLENYRDSYDTVFYNS